MRKIILVTGGILMTAAFFAHADDLDKALGEAKNRTVAAKSKELSIQSQSAKNQALDSTYRYTLRYNEELKKYNQQLLAQVKAQEKELKTLSESTANIKLIERKTMPMLLDMAQALEKFVAADTPFKLEKRMASIQGLKDLLGRADVTGAEKYNQILGAYDKETRYGETIESYGEMIEVDGVLTEVDMLRVGRISLIYRTLDGHSAAYWDKDSSSWVGLTGKQVSKLNEAFKIAQEQAAPDLISIPVSIQSLMAVKK